MNPSVYSVTILRALQGRPLYHGTVAYAEIQRRRRRNKVAKETRRANRP